jgi:hypothetical protein
MKLDLFAPYATLEQRLKGLQAALAVFAAAGLSPLAASTAYFDVGEEASAPSSAQVRAARIWSTASDSALKACYSAAPVPAMARLVVVAGTSAFPGNSP